MQLALDATLLRTETAAPAVTELDDMDVLVRTYRPRLLRFVAFSIGDADLAESIIQDCFLKAYQYRASFRGDSSVYTWLSSIAVNLIRDQQRLGKFRFWRKAQASAIDVQEVANCLPMPANSPESQCIAREKVAAISAALGTLSASQRSIFLMRFSDEMEIAEICAATGMPARTVKTHLHRAVKVIRAHLGSAR